MKFARLLLVALLCLTGCASSRLTHEPGLVTSWDHTQHAVGVPPIGIALHARQLRFDVPVGAYFGPHWSHRATQKQLNGVMREFAFLQTDPTNPAPYQLVVEATHATGGSKRWSKVSKMTNFLIPCVENSEVEVEARLMRDGVVVKTYDAVGTYKTKKHLLYVLWPPAWHRNVPGDATADTFRDVFLQIERDAGTLTTGTAVPAPTASAKTEPTP